MEADFSSPAPTSAVNIMSCRCRIAKEFSASPQLNGGKSASGVYSALFRHEGAEPVCLRTGPRHARSWRSNGVRMSVSCGLSLLPDGVDGEMIAERKDGVLRI